MKVLGKCTAVFAGLLLAGAAGCVTDRKLLREYRKTEGRPLSGTVRVDGRYYNLAADTSTLLLDQLLQCKGFNCKDRLPSDSGSTVVLQRTGDRRLTLSVTGRNGATQTAVLRVKERRGYLSLHRQVFLLPVPFFLFRRTQKAILACDTNGRLLTVSSYSGTGWVLFIVTGTDWIKTNSFSKAGL